MTATNPDESRSRLRLVRTVRLAPMSGRGGPPRPRPSTPTALLVGSPGGPRISFITSGAVSTTTATACTGRTLTHALSRAAAGSPFGTARLSRSRRAPQPRLGGSSPSAVALRPPGTVMTAKGCATSFERLLTAIAAHPGVLSAERYASHFPDYSAQRRPPGVRAAVERRLRRGRRHQARTGARRAEEVTRAATHPAFTKQTLGNCGPETQPRGDNPDQVDDLVGALSPAPPPGRGSTIPLNGPVCPLGLCRTRAEE